MVGVHAIEKSLEQHVYANKRVQIYKRLDFLSKKKEEVEKYLPL